MNLHKQNSRCTKKCIIQVIEVISGIPELHKKFSELIHKLQMVDNTNKKKHLNNFYKYTIDNNYVLCNLGLYYMEKYIFDNMYFFLLYNLEDYRNNFINNKILLYEWIEFEHLEINFKNDENDFYNIFYEYDLFEKLILIGEYLNGIKGYTLPVYKLHVLMCTIKQIYRVVGSESSLDDIFPILIFIIIKSRIKDFCLHLNFTNLYYRENRNKCIKNCIHLLNSSVTTACECYEYIEFDQRQVDYYMTCYDSALIFIERLEFKSIKIDATEYENKIVKNIQKLEPYNIPKRKNKEKSILKKTKNKLLGYFKNVF
ncbi:hypothetical protein COBT_000472 [Conglomerata obtusa]